MHKVIYKPNNTGKKEYKELCSNVKCKKGTLWVYGDDFVGPVCGDCKQHLDGKPMMAREGARRLYHLKK